MAEFGKTIADAYRFEGESIELGRDAAAKSAALYAKYGTRVDRERAIR